MCRTKVIPRKDRQTDDGFQLTGIDWGAWNLKLSRKGEYACLALIRLAQLYGMRLMKIEEIAEDQGIPRKYLEQILLLLKTAGYVRSARGAAGGYRLAKRPDEITLAEVIRLIDGPLAPVESVSKFFYVPTPVERSAKLTGMFREIRDYVADKLERTTFADLI